MMSVVSDDDKHNLKYEAPADNLRLTRHTIDNRLGIVNHDVALSGTSLILWNECENPSDATTISLKRLIYKLFSPSSNELALNYLESSMDRRCWAWNVLVMLELAGAHVLGTINRCVWFSFTCGQTLKK